MELTQDQFDILKAIVNSHVYVVVIPDLLPTDPQVVLDNHAKHIELFATFVASGFAENITNRFTDTIEEIRKEREGSDEGSLLMRGFSAYCLTEMAVRMFSAPEGLVN